MGIILKSDYNTNIHVFHPSYSNVSNWGNNLTVINWPLKDRDQLQLYLNIQFVPRSKHNPSQLYKPVS
jgi:hypothetical protein